MTMNNDHSVRRAERRLARMRRRQRRAEETARINSRTTEQNDALRQSARIAVELPMVNTGNAQRRRRVAVRRANRRSG